MQPGREINRRKQRRQIEHTRALLAYLESSEPHARPELPAPLDRDHRDHLPLLSASGSGDT